MRLKTIKRWPVGSSHRFIICSRNMSVLVDNSLLSKQDQGHECSLHYKAHANGDDVQGVFQHNGSQEQHHKACPKKRHHIQTGHSITQSSHQGQQGGHCGTVQHNGCQPAQGVCGNLAQMIGQKITDYLQVKRPGVHERSP